jgi:hypothetical protein
MADARDAGVTLDVHFKKGLLTHAGTKLNPGAVDTRPYKTKP